MDIFFQPICIVSVILLKMKMFSIFSVFFMRKSGKIQEKSKKIIYALEKIANRSYIFGLSLYFKNNGLLFKKVQTK